MHYLCTNANYNKPKEIKDYIEEKEKNQGISTQEWQMIFETFCRMGELSLQKWILNAKVQLMEDKDFAINCLFLIIGRYETNLRNVKQMVERLDYLLKFIPDEIKGDILGTAFVIACEYNNIFLIKYLLEQDTDINYKYKGLTEPDDSYHGIIYTKEK